MILCMAVVGLCLAAFQLVGNDNGKHVVLLPGGQIKKLTDEGLAELSAAQQVPSEGDTEIPVEEPDAPSDLAIVQKFCQDNDMLLVSNQAHSEAVDIYDRAKSEAHDLKGTVAARDAKIRTLELQLSDLKDRAAEQVKQLEQEVFDLKSAIANTPDMAYGAHQESPAEPNTQQDAAAPEKAKTTKKK
jgi:hypothetical protein